jgi:glycosyltransferase involved in cell wall biosynthesis
MLVPLEPEVIARRAGALLASAETRAGSARWGRRRVAEVYNWAAVCDGYEAVLRKAARDADSDSRSRFV